MNRRNFLFASLIVVIMLDGFGLEYCQASDMPTLKQEGQSQRKANRNSTLKHHSFFH